MSRPLRRAVVCALVAGLLIFAVTISMDAQFATADTRFRAFVGLARISRDRAQLDAAVRYFRQADRMTAFDGDLLVEFFWAAHRAEASGYVRTLGQRILTTNPHGSDVRDAMIGSAAKTKDEPWVRRLATAGMTVQPDRALWPRRLGESFLRTAEYLSAATAFQSASGLPAATPEDDAQRAMALEIAGELRAAIDAWHNVDEAVWSSRAEWIDSRARASRPTPPPLPTPAPKVWTPAAIVADSERILTEEPCAIQPLRALDALDTPEPLLAAVEQRPSSCPDHHAWTSHAVERAIASGLLGRALTLAQAGAAVSGAPIEIEEQLGILLHWNGRHADAEPVLQAVVTRDSDQERAIEALVEVRRVLGDSEGAWTLAKAHWDASAASHKRLALAELALETGRHKNALVSARELSTIPGVRTRAQAVMGSALLALGRPRAARPILEQLVPTPAPSLAWLDSIAATEGVAAALVASERLPTVVTPTWADVVARRALWHVRLGHRRRSDRLVEALAAIDPLRARLTEAEIALASGRPADAERDLLGALDMQPGNLRALDGLSTALAEQGRWDEAEEILTTLRSSRPHEHRFAVRDAEWRHRQTPTRATLGVLESMVRDEFHVDARSALARAYFADGAPDRALATLGTNLTALPESDAILAARCLRGIDRSGEALELLRARDELPPAGRVLQAELLAAQEDHVAARREFLALTRRPDVDPFWYIGWADVEPREEEALRILTEGTTRFPAHAGLHERLAVAAWSGRDRNMARTAADAALELDDQKLGAWFVKAELDSTGDGPDRLLDTLRDFGSRFSDNPSALIGMANLLAGSTRSRSDPAALAALDWIESILVVEPDHAEAIMAKARLEAARQNLSPALQIVDTLVAGRPELPAALRLKAELLAAGGRHAEAVEAFDDYLLLAPRDFAARRQQARIDGWRGAFDDALARYRRLLEDDASNAAIVAEAAAKHAYYRGHWHEAVERYVEWLRVEPDDVEARLELAQVYDRIGEPARASEAFRRVTTAAPNAVSQIALERLERRRRAHVDLFASTQSAEAVERQQLLSLVDTGAGVSDDLGLGYGTRVRAFGGPSFAEGGDEMWQGQHVGGQLSAAPAGPLRLNGSVTYRRLETLDGQWFGNVGLAWRARATLRVSAGYERTLLLENRTTLLDGIAGRGPTAGIEWTPTSDIAVAVTGSRSELSDGNRRHLLRVSASQRVLRGRNELRMLLSADSMTYRADRPTYFTPTALWRYDLGAEWRGTLAAPQFFGDRERVIAAGYLIGFDDRQEMYHTGRLSLSHEVANGMSIVADAHLVRSRVYAGGRVTIGLRFKHVALPGL